MAWTQDLRPPKKERLEFTIGNFSGGLNNRSNVIEDNQASDMLNMQFLHQDVLEKRHGFKRFDELVLSEPITYLDLFKPYNDDDQLIRATNTEVYANQVKIADVQGEIDGVNYQGNFFFTDGESLQVYGHFTEVTGTYVEVVGNHPQTYTTLTVVNPPDGYEPLEEIHQQGKTVYNYDDGTVHYEPCVNELDDVYLGANLQPEHPKFIEVHKGRLFVSGDRKDDDNVFITDLNAPFYFAVGLPIQLPPNSDKVRGMTVYDDNLIVGREYDIYRITGETSNPELGFELFTLRKVNSHTGIANNKCFDTAHNYLFFLGSDGIAYALTTVRMDERLVSTQIISNTIDVFKSPINADSALIRDASTCFDNEFWYVTIGDKTLVYSYRHKAWTLFDYVDIYSPLYYYDKIIWGRKDGMVAEFGDNYLDDGRPIYAFWQSKAYDMDSATRYKQFREFYIVAHAFDDNDSEIRVTFEIDYSNMMGEAVVKNELSIFGKSRFGDRFIDRNINTSIPFMIGRRARNMRIAFENGYKVNHSVPTEIDLNDIPRKYNYMGAFVEETQSYYHYLNGTWERLSDKEINQPMRVYQVNGDYEMKGKR